MGAVVTKIEPPAGDPMRQRPPFVHPGQPDQTSALFLHLNAGKQSVTLDLESAAGRTLLQRLVQRADVAIESFAPGWLEARGLGYDALRAVNPRLVLTSITPFGQTGPYRDFKATEIGMRAISGELYMAGQPPQPLKKGGNIAQYLGGVNGFIGSMGALFQREATGLGEHINVSITEAMSSIVGQALREEAASGYISGRRQGGLGWPINVYTCKDGYMMTFTAYAAGDSWWHGFASMICEGQDIEIPASPPREPEALAQWDQRFRDWLSTRTRREVLAEAQKHRLAFGLLATAADLLDSPQLEHRRFFATATNPEAGEHTLMSLPFLVDGVRWPVHAAPSLGAQNVAVGIETPDSAGLKTAGVPS